MGLLRKKIKPVNQYQVWVHSGFATDGFLDDDILAISDSLGHRAAHSVTIENRAGGTATVRLNVVKKLFRQHNEFHNNIFKDLGTSAVLVGEVEETRPDIELADGVTMTFSGSEIAISDVKVVVATSGLRIIAT